MADDFYPVMNDPRVVAARELLKDLCADHRLKMSIPVQEVDEDTVLYRLFDVLREQQAEIKRLQRYLDGPTTTEHEVK